MPTGENVIFKRGLSSSMPTTYESGTILIQTDTGDIFLDNSSTERVQITDTRKMDKFGSVVNSTPDTTVISSEGAEFALLNQINTGIVIKHDIIEFQPDMSDEVELKNLNIDEGELAY